MYINIFLSCVLTRRNLLASGAHSVGTTCWGCCMRTLLGGVSLLNRPSSFHASRCWRHPQMRGWSWWSGHCRTTGTDVGVWSSCAFKSYISSIYTGSASLKLENRLETCLPPPTQFSQNTMTGSHPTWTSVWIWSVIDSHKEQTHLLTLQ